LPGNHFTEARLLRRLAELGDVGAGDEGAPGAGQHDGIKLRIAARALDRVVDAAPHRGH